MTATTHFLASGPGWRADDVICTSGPRDRAFEEQHDGVCVAAVTRGTFQYRSTQGAALLTPGALLLGQDRHCFECGHDHGTGTIHFGWVLEGRAIQDVWILPGVFHGTTLRVYDPALDAWHILWSDPLCQFYARQTGRAVGEDIVQDGTDGAGNPIRWRFTDITSESFLWIGERSSDGGATWQRQTEFSARRL
jgi:hypothetical protein